MPGSTKWSLSLTFPHQNPVYASSLPHSCYMPRPSHLLSISNQYYHIMMTFQYMISKM
jgi:hypothetical protein